MRVSTITALALCSLLSVSSCSVVMEASRPDPVDLSQFTIGEGRPQIVESLGAPTTTIKDGDNSCDVYKIYTRGPGGAGKGAIAATEAVADVFTLGLAEVISSPVEGATKNQRHTVTFCYDKTSSLVTMRDAPPGGT